jgi:hypothetical protein
MKYRYVAFFLAALLILFSVFLIKKNDSTLSEKLHTSISTYQTARDEFYIQGGKEFLSQRQNLRASFAQGYNWFLEKESPSQAIKTFTDSIPSLNNPNMNIKWEARSKEWIKKIANNKLVGKGKITIEEFTVKRDDFYKKWTPFILSSASSDFHTTKASLREALLLIIKPYLVNVDINDVKSVKKALEPITRQINDAEINHRIIHEWSWKA